MHKSPRSFYSYLDENGDGSNRQTSSTMSSTDSSFPEMAATNSDKRSDASSPSSPPWRLGSILQLGADIDIDELLSIFLSLVGLILSVCISLGSLQTGSWSRDTAVAIYSLTADLGVGAILAGLYGVISALAQNGKAINYELLTILGSLEPRTSYRFSEISIRKLVLFLVLSLLTFGPDQLVNFALPQDRQVRVRSTYSGSIFLGTIGGGFTDVDDVNILHEYKTTGLKFMSETTFAEQERHRVAMQLSELEYFLPLKPDILYNGSASTDGDSQFVSALDVPDNYGISMNMTTGANSCNMSLPTRTRGESFGAVFTTSALRIDEYSVTLCSAFKTRSGEVYRADFHLSNRSANVRYSSDGVTNRIEQVGPLSNPQPLQRVDQIDIVRHNMTDCFLNMMVFVNAIEKDEDMSSVGIGLVIRAANATNAYGFHGGRGLIREAEITMGSLVYGGTGVVFWFVVIVSLIRFGASGIVLYMKPILSGDTRQNIAVYSPIAGLLPESFSSRANRQLARRLGIPKVIIGFEKAAENDDENTITIRDYRLRTTVIEGEQKIRIVAGSPEKTVAWSEVGKYVKDSGKVKIW